MVETPHTQVLIAGGGLGGLISALLLHRAGIKVVLIEKNTYPFHRVCGEYVSNETRGFLERNGLFPRHLHPTEINELHLTAVNGSSLRAPLDLGGFGISRYHLDNFLYQQALREGVAIHCGSRVDTLRFTGNVFEVETSTGNWTAEVVIGGFGKRSRLDRELERPFFLRRSPYIGVKYHMRMAHPSHVVALHNFKGGYCGVNAVEGGIVNVCYLSHREALKTHGDIPTLEKKVLQNNPFLREVFEQAQPLFDRPEVINEISFATKGPVHNHVLMTGDAAGMITPLCGNGMAMAIHSASVLAPLVIRYFNEPGISRTHLETNYAHEWNTLFAQRLWAGRQIQRLFGNAAASNLAVQLGLWSPAFTRFLVKRTHGKPF
jgi:menaquinone-9 beta-reductase